MFLNFKEIPGSHNLFLDYLYDFNKVSEFYELDFRNKALFEQKFREISSASKNRSELSSLIRKQYQDIQPSAITLENIKKLGSTNSLAVVTGQQLGIFGGPLYTTYKIITAIKLAGDLNNEFKAYNFIPVFWLEGDDHDFEEISSINLITESNELMKISYNIDSVDEENRGSVGKIKIENKIDEFISGTKETLKETEFTESILQHLRGFYSAGKTFGHAFRELIFWLFDKYGLLIFDPQDPKAKQLLIPVFKKEISDFRRHSETLVKVSAKLEESYHAQVKVRAINLFHTYDEGRYLIEPVDNEFRLKRKRKRFTSDEINDLIEKEPESFSPNVLLRPVCQDYLLPTALYVAGPGEISYFSQALPLYDFYEIAPPIIYPRASATLLEKNIASILDKFNLSIQEMFKDQEEIKSRILSSISEQNVQILFDEAEENLKMVFEKLKDGLYGIDKTTGDSSSRYYDKIVSYLDELKNKAEQAHSKKHEVTMRQLMKASINLYPERNLQERELNLIYYMNKYGPQLLDQIFSELKTDEFNHQVIYL